MKKESNSVNSYMSFWKNEYRKFSEEEKIDFWTADIHKGMRSQGEYGLDEYSMFTPEWYQRVLQYEPKFDEIMLMVIPGLGFMFAPVQCPKQTLATGISIDIMG